MPFTQCVPCRRPRGVGGRLGGGVVASGLQRAYLASQLGHSCERSPPEERHVAITPRWRPAHSYITADKPSLQTCKYTCNAPTLNCAASTENSNTRGAQLAGGHPPANHIYIPPTALSITSTAPAAHPASPSSVTPTAAEQPYTVALDADAVETRRQAAPRTVTPRPCNRTAGGRGEAYFREPLVWQT